MGGCCVRKFRPWGYTGTHKSVNKLVSPWRVGNVAYESHAPFPILPATRSDTWRS